jgi:hypothetical protein
MLSTARLAPFGGRSNRDSRRSQRVALAAPGDLVSLEGKRPVLLINLCERGAMVEMTMPPAVGSEVLLFFGDVEAEGSIVWRSPEHCGIRFHYPISQTEIDVEAIWSKQLLEELLGK